MYYSIQVSELEVQLDREQRSCQEYSAELKKVQRQLLEIKAAWESDKRLISTFTEKISSYETKITSISRKLHDSVLNFYTHNINFQFGPYNIHAQSGLNRMTFFSV